jgi:hypothetical protein
MSFNTFCTKERSFRIDITFIFDTSIKIKLFVRLQNIKQSFIIFKADVMFGGEWDILKS